MWRSDDGRLQWHRALDYLEDLRERLDPLVEPALLPHKPPGWRLATEGVNPWDAILDHWDLVFASRLGPDRRRLVDRVRHIRNELMHPEQHGYPDAAQVKAHRGTFNELLAAFGAEPIPVRAATGASVRPDLVELPPRMEARRPAVASGTVGAGPWSSRAGDGGGEWTSADPEERRRRLYRVAAAVVGVALACGALIYARGLLPADFPWTASAPRVAATRVARPAPTPRRAAAARIVSWKVAAASAGAQLYRPGYLPAALRARPPTVTLPRAPARGRATEVVATYRAADGGAPALTIRQRRREAKETALARGARVSGLEDARWARVAGARKLVLERKRGESRTVIELAGLPERELVRVAKSLRPEGS